MIFVIHLNMVGTSALTLEATRATRDYAWNTSCRHQKCRSKGGYETTRGGDG